MGLPPSNWGLDPLLPMASPIRQHQRNIRYSIHFIFRLHRLRSISINGYENKALMGAKDNLPQQMGQVKRINVILA